jgi:hypothetical protein
METWDLWFPDAAATGLPFCRASIDPAPAVLVHACPAVLAVEVRDADGQLVARGERLERAGPHYPMTRLWREGDLIRRADGWPLPEDIGLPVLLPGGEAGVLTAWWNAEDGSAWRWSVEFYNAR